VFRDLCQQMLQIFVDLQIIGLCSLHQTVDRCAGFGTVDGINDVPIRSANCERTDGTLCCGVIDGDISVLQEYTQVFLLVDTVV
jgi:hypothetical protein